MPNHPTDPTLDAAEPESLRILVVEDDDDTRSNLCDILSLHGHLVSLQASFQATIELPELPQQDVILLDRKLPDGLVEERLPEIRKRAPQADLIVATGYADTQASIAALREGVTDYLIKPIAPDQLLRSLQHIARRRKVERELAEEHEFAEMVLQTAEAVVLVLDPEGRIIRFNAYLAEITGHSLDEVREHDWFETFIPERERERVRQVFRNTLSEQRSRGILNSILTRSGRLKEIRWSNNVILDRAGSVTGVLAIGLDVTDLMEAERKARRGDRLAVIGQTMAGMAHESRNALQRIRNSIELLEDELEGNQEALRYVEKISRAGTDLRNLLEEVRGYAAPIQLERVEVPLHTIWRRAWASLEHKRHAAILVEESPDDELSAWVDARKLEQVFRNLFENALDACGEEVEVTVACDLVPSGVRIRVSDNGPGIPDDVRKRVFDAFFTTKPTGTGLGMAIANRILESHDGSIQVLDTQEGTTFEIILP